MKTRMAISNLELWIQSREYHCADTSSCFSWVFLLCQCYPGTSIQTHTILYSAQCIHYLSSLSPKMFFPRPRNIAILLASHKSSLPETGGTTIFTLFVIHMVSLRYAKNVSGLSCQLWCGGGESSISAEENFVDCASLILDIWLGRKSGSTELSSLPVAAGQCTNEDLLRIKICCWI